jgi:DNA-binding transcriptional ArsR family regulator
MEEPVLETEAVGTAVRLLRTLSDPTRLRLLGVLQQGEHNVTGLCQRLELPQPTISHHLGLLRSAGLVSNRRDGKQVFYSLNGRAVSQLEPKCGLAISTGPLELHIRSPEAENGEIM